MKKLFFDLPGLFVLISLLLVFLAHMTDVFNVNVYTFELFTMLSLYVGGVMTFSKTINTRRIGYGLYAYGILNIYLLAMQSAVSFAEFLVFIAFILLYLQ